MADVYCNNCGAGEDELNYLQAYANGEEWECTICGDRFMHSHKESDTFPTNPKVKIKTKKEAIEDIRPKFPLIIECADYHDFDTTKRVLNNMGLPVNYKELPTEPGQIHRAVFFLDMPPEDATNLPVTKMIL
jgi:hypothetical protein